jgi:hypothetical protein
MPYKLINVLEKMLAVGSGDIIENMPGVHMLLFSTTPKFYAANLTYTMLDVCFLYMRIQCVFILERQQIRAVSSGKPIMGVRKVTIIVGVGPNCHIWGIFEAAEGGFPTWGIRSFGHNLVFDIWHFWFS